MARIKYYSSISKDWLDIDRVSELLGIEKQCVERQPDGCNRECESCSLVQNREELIEIYNTAINIIEMFKKILGLKE